MTELQYRQAADLFGEAANLVPSGSAYEDKRISYLNREAAALFRQGYEFADSTALGSAIERYKGLVNLTPRERVPLEWAATQNNLGLALETLGEREAGTARLEEAVAAYSDALMERTHVRAPRDWAISFGNQAVALMRFAERTREAAMAEMAFHQIEVALAAANPAWESTGKDAVHNRDVVARKMTTAQIAEAQKLASEWKPKLP
jgi:tetratricopeptide (TPR) repeat protein